jgi:hypothetical protein
MAQTRSYSCDKMMMRQAEWDISDLITKFLPSSDEKESYPPWELFVTPCCLSLKINHFDSFHIQGLYISASTVSDFH